MELNYKLLLTRISIALIILLIIFILLSLYVNIDRVITKNKMEEHVCANKLMLIWDAKQEYLEKHSDVDLNEKLLDWDSIAPYLKGPIRGYTNCPAGGKISLNLAKEYPSCSIEEHNNRFRRYMKEAKQAKEEGKGVAH